MRPMPIEKNERDKRIIEMRKNGSTLSEIAKEVGLTLTSVRNIVEREQHYDTLREKFPKILSGDYALPMRAFNPIARHLRIIHWEYPRKVFAEAFFIDFLLHASDEELLSIRNVGVKTLSEIENWRSHYAEV